MPGKRREPEERPEFLLGLVRYQREGIVRFHTPGHRGGGWTYPAWAQAVGMGCLSLDVSDVLHGEEGPADWSQVLRRAEKRAARHFGAHATRFLVNGTSGGIHAAILALAAGEKVLFSRASHLSVYAGAILAQAVPRYVDPVYDREWDIVGPPPVGELQRVCQRERPKLLVVTYPDYYGLALPGDRLAHGVGETRILADEAHGAHFLYSPQAPAPALAWGCAVSVQSTHKMLGALTQASMLHVSPKASDVVFALDRALSLLQTTSPSALLLASLEAAVMQGLENGRDEWERALALAESIREEIERSTPFHCLSPDVAASRWQAQLDPARLVIHMGESGWTGLAAARYLRQEWKIQVELANQRAIVLLVTPGNTKADGEVLIAALRALSVRAPKKPAETLAPPPRPPQRMLPWEALRQPVQWVKFKDSVGRIASDILCPYPPGIPIAVPGEEITPEIVAYLEHVTAHGWEVRGAFDPRLRRIAVVKESGAR